MGPRAKERSSKHIHICIYIGEPGDSLRDHLRRARSKCMFHTRADVSRHICSSADQVSTLGRYGFG